MRHTFARQWLPILLVVLGGFLVFVTFMLGRWQDTRAQFKTQQYVLEQTRSQLPEVKWGEIAQFDGNMAQFHHRKVQLTGQYIPNGVLYIDNRQVNGVPAVQVIQAFKPEGLSIVIPVERGYLLRNPALPRILPNWRDVQQGKIQISGTILPHVARSAEWRGFWFGNANFPVIQQLDGRHLWSNFSSSQWAQLLGLPVANWILRANPEPMNTNSHGQQYAQEANLVWPTVNMNVQTHPADKHRAYALQWYGLSIAAAITCLILLWKEFKSWSVKC